MTINGTNWVNDGTIEAINGGPVNLTGSWTNGGTISTEQQHGEPVQHDHSGHAGHREPRRDQPGSTQSSASLNLGSQTLDSTIGPLTLAGGTINGGTVVVANTILSVSGTLNDVRCRASCTLWVRCT